MAMALARRRNPAAIHTFTAAAAIAATAGLSVPGGTRLDVLPPCPEQGCVKVAIDFGSAPVVNASTASTVEVDVMPFLGRTPEGGPFEAYFEALSNLGSDFVRFAPWYPYPRVVVTELTPPDCTTTTPATNWNSTLFDGIVRDFMAAVW